jgi:hypothetical protein
MTITDGDFTYAAYAGGGNANRGRQCLPGNFPGDDHFPGPLCQPPAMITNPGKDQKLTEAPISTRRAGPADVAWPKNDDNWLPTKAL